ncbi:HAMP domain-containing histidine kinase [Brucella pituitosa]|uniref:histidine kinase n=1 Tax=Brucella pituitosa TaxID=571256 RepID=A0A643F4J3_9HYPH|nr:MULTISPECIES: HAMP domain-containing histidine kinase [Brucella]PQZ51804.1 HAMP domain-containing histidine kinase [Ochrobactrum sp. MYb19]PRA56468.1 HAMP domain-containing histidine kinase [Ochrobactrum sp. MYb68]PRA65162.1 HAMP domain-containing histidine kinase [Ochrobactrum sp. MYb18]PRA76851.1 HAMP domain-containing histidine kinase [Brucella thiophenivorans]PRA86132.1 HAMP domain-containing histidine kinase [Ochrobactrum sp. MYb29]PRA93515.1 HAMP domain-containing histidine kinase [O
MRCIDATLLGNMVNMNTANLTTDMDGEERSSRAGEGRRLLALPGIITVVSALITASISFAILIGITPITPDRNVTLALVIVNVALIVFLILLICREVYRIVSARRSGKAASRLHVRIVALFSLIAAIPAILVAIVASVTLNLGLDRWFDTNTRDIVSSSQSLTTAYIRETALNLQSTSFSMLQELDAQRTLYSLDRGGFIRYMTLQAGGRGLLGAFLVREGGDVIVKSETGVETRLPPPTEDALKTAVDGKPVIIPPGNSNFVGAVIKMREIPDLYLYTVRAVDQQILEAMRLMEANTQRYQEMDANRIPTQIAFALLYFGLTLILLLSAIWTGIAVADRLVRPIRLLIGAADNVAAGNLDISVPVRSSDGDVGALSGTFNNMVAELKSQRNELISAKDQIDERRRFSEAVLSGVTAGVIGIESDGSISILNRSAEHMFGVSSQDAIGKSLTSIAPEIGQAFEVARTTGRTVHREQVSMTRGGAARNFNVQVTVEDAESDDYSYVVTVDDITDLVQAQRSSAWADVARRIAHEIKNPLTPIQLSAERIRRRYGKVITEDREVFDQCTETIIRQVGDIGRMVDEFSAFARMPKPEMRAMDLREALREASFLIEVSRNDIHFNHEYGSEKLIGSFDSRLLGQAFGNVIKNASEAIDAVSKEERGDGYILVRSQKIDGQLVVDVIDNGKGLPGDDRQKLLEPYMTTREKGTGLGLAIVRKIVEEHGGHLELHDAPADFHGGRGAMIRMIFPEISTGVTGTEEGNHGNKIIGQVN